MKKLVLSLMAAVALMFVPQALTAVNFVQYLATYGNSLTVGTDTLGGVTYSTVRYGDLYNGGEPGMPSLPIDYIRFSVPYNATNFTVTASPSRWSTANLSYLLYPCQMPWIPNDSIAPPIMLPDTAAYYSGVSYPSQMAWVADEGFLAGENHIVTVAVMPFRYTHSSTSDEVRKCRNLNVRLNYELSDSLAMPINPNGGLGGDGLNFAGDPGELGPNEPDSTWTNMGEIIMSGHFPYLIVTTSDLKHSVRRIAALKRQKGYNVKVVTLDDVFSSPCSRPGDVIGKGNNAYLTFTDNAGKLRQYIRYYFENLGTKYVLLVGTSIPYRHIIGMADDWQIQKTIDCISDFYYSELHSDWSEDTIRDHAPELYVGRILAKKSTQIDNYTEKLFRYELNPGNGDHLYLQRLLLEEGSFIPGGLSQFKNTIFNIFPDSCAIEFKESVSFYRPTGKEVIDTLNSTPVGLINILNHGDTTKVYVYFDQDKREHVIKSINSIAEGDGLNCLNNRNYPMIFYSPACQTVPFDNQVGINVGESFTTGKYYGGPVYIGNTRTIVNETTRYVASCFAKRLKDGYYTLREADALSVWDSNNAFIRYQDASLIHAYIGDPSVELWTGIPHQFNSISVTRTDNSITISGIDKDSTVVSYSNYDRASKTIVNSSSVTINDSPNASVMLYGHNSLPYIIPMELQNVNLYGSQYIITSDFKAGDSIDSNRSSGYVTIKEGARYEIEASGTTTLCDGFIVEVGATFAVVPSSFGDNRLLY